jgi:lipoate-protein ligase A
VPIAVLPGAAIVAEAAAMLERASAGEAAAAAFVFERPTLVIGSAQGGDRVGSGLEVVRRGSGGGAVYCDRDLLDVSVALPPRHPLVGTDLTESYRWLGEAWLEVLEAAGVAARLVSVAEARAMGDAQKAAARVACFAGVSPYEVLSDDGRKLVGLAQRRRRGAALLHCAVPTAGGQRRVLDHVDAGLAGAFVADTDPLPAPRLLWEAMEPVLAARLAAATAIRR